MCVGLDLKDAILHVPMSAQVKKSLMFTWRGKIYEWQVLPFDLKCSSQILTYMVATIFKFLHGRGVILMAFMYDFTNQARCRCKVIFQIHVIALVFMCCDWSINWVKTILELTGVPLHLGFLWDTLRMTITFTCQPYPIVNQWPSSKYMIFY